MTMILALNLSDRIVLATDTLVSRKKDDGREIIGYYPKLQQYADKGMKGFVGCMYAGNLRYSRYLSKNIAEAIDNGRLPTGIHELRASVRDFLTSVTQKYQGKDEEKHCIIIFAGTGSPSSVKPYDFNRVSDIMGPEGFHINDEMVVEALKNGQIPGQENVSWLPIRDQLTFSFVIDYRNNYFNEGEIGKIYSVICAGCVELGDEEKKMLIRHFISRRASEDEGKDFITYIRKHVSNAIGGAVMLGIIDKQGPLKYCHYNVDRTGPRHDSNWSIDDQNPMVAIDPDSARIDLMRLHWAEEDEGGMEI